MAPPFFNLFLLDKIQLTQHFFTSLIQETTFQLSAIDFHFFIVFIVDNATFLPNEHSLKVSHILSKINENKQTEKPVIFFLHSISKFVFERNANLKNLIFWKVLPHSTYLPLFISSFVRSFICLFHSFARIIICTYISLLVILSICSSVRLYLVLLGYDQQEGRGACVKIPRSFGTSTPTHCEKKSHSCWWTLCENVLT